MKHRMLFMIGAIVLFIYGLLWFIVPAFGLNLHGHEVVTTDLASVITRYWGSAYIAIAVILWLAKEAEAESIAVRAIIAGGFVMLVLGLLAAINDVLYGGPNAVIWVAVALYVIFGVWFGVLLFKKQA